MSFAYVYPNISNHTVSPFSGTLYTWLRSEGQTVMISPIIFGIGGLGETSLFLPIIFLELLHLWEKHDSLKAMDP